MFFPRGGSAHVARALARQLPAAGWDVTIVSGSRHGADARRFYATIVAGTLIGVAVNFLHIDPMKLLFWTAVINGVVAVPLMVLMMLMTMRRDVMGQFTLPRPLWVIGWAATAVMVAAVITMFATWGG